MGTTESLEAELLRAATVGNVDRVCALLEAGVPVDPPSCHPLAAAAGAGRLSVVEVLLIAGARIDRLASEAAWSTPLFLAAKAGHLRVVERLVKEGAALGPPDPEDAGNHRERVQWVERTMGPQAWRVAGVTYRRCAGEPGWNTLIEHTNFGGNGEYSIVLVNAPIERTSPAVQEVDGSERLLSGIHERWQLAPRNTRWLYLVQLARCPWTLVLHEVGGHHRYAEGEHLAREVSRSLGRPTIHATLDDVSDQEEFTAYEGGRRTGRTTEPSMVIDQGIRLPGVDSWVARPPVLIGVGPDDVLGVDVLIEPWT
ncbi:ankyrin repeat domain-containing protein [Paraliomyxa miuraensis]|uniref:ankyrin repeat domain-containing protein n=1 Tax=Paraliomyxa miuraensis TaxID=376150 RepID=UPI00224E7E8E|nr:ankyrin repeat domain-containing protein [Paraliomyxa miuraensis]MCX4239710.1 ankyrin repeat domain-containing protein [Paraliomyxa miuraensis]